MLSAGEPGTTQPLTLVMGSAAQAMPVKMMTANRKFIKTPADRIQRRVRSGWRMKLRGSSDSPSSPSSRTNPPSGSQFSV